MFSDVIKNLKSVNGLTNKDISERSGISERTICRICNGEMENPSLIVLKGLSRCFDVPMDILAEQRSDRIIRREELSHMQKYRYLSPELRKNVDNYLQELVDKWDEALNTSFNMKLRNYCYGKIGSMPASDVVSLIHALKEIRPDIVIDFDL